ncbi:hypothetical protein D7V64_07620 [Acinetobacter cumulans]|uniref:Uncharacterized protein n=1 Tax=Acinetobacter cumulans TaxID=2136182 RepID=A0A3A8G5T8_9GAMM|nr:hypothetical protein D7V64_07620 [Acinetobacter cumulans]RLL49591.1 hypothetical protein D9K79_02050 [Acinetobacter cumulans]
MKHGLKRGNLNNHAFTSYYTRYSLCLAYNWQYANGIQVKKPVQIKGGHKRIGNKNLKNRKFIN